MRFVSITLLCILLLSNLGCQKESIKDQIDEYLTTNNLTAEVTSEGLYYIIDEEGSTEKPDINSVVTVHYLGTLLSGKKFDSSYDRGVPAEFPLTNVIRGWKLGIPLFGKGGKGKLIIPPSLGYGSSGTNNIPGNSVLVFDIELFDFE